MSERGSAETPAKLKAIFMAARLHPAPPVPFLGDHTPEKWGRG
ncbi:MAG: hypothetical protein WDM78_10260 [Puia sp.]